MTKEHFEFYGGLLSALVFIGTLFKYWYKNRSAFYTTIQGKIKIQAEQDKLFKKYDNIVKVLTLATSNGGGMPVKENSVKVTIAFESTDLSKKEGIIDKWQNVPAESTYYRLLNKMIEHHNNSITTEYYKFLTRDLDKYDKLRTSLEAQEVTECRMYYVGQAYWKLLWFFPLFPVKLFYVGINHRTPLEGHNPEYDDDINNFVEFLRKELI